ncbi:hypothetical protein [Salipiger thiooxidans]|nr:hypothetical protein [Salipiger thiooxidans]
MVWKKNEREPIDSKALAETEVVFSNFSAAQVNAEGFILVGTIHFNPGEITFDEGRAEFALRQARITALGRGCACDYESIAYIARSTDEVKQKAQVTKTVDNKKGGEAQAEGQAAVSLTKGIAIGASMQGRLRRAFDEQELHVVGSESEGARALITAIPKKRSEGRAVQVDWIVRPDPLIPFETPLGTFSVLIGERMRAANQGAGLAVVQMTEPGGYLEMRLDIRVADIEWTAVEFSETSKLHQFGKRIVDGKAKRDIVGRLALGKAIEGSMQLGRLPREAKNE